MLSAIVLLVVSLGAGAFMCSRVYLLVVRRELNVKGAVYSLAETPFRYWTTLIFAVAGTIMTLGFAILAGVGLTVR